MVVVVMVRLVKVVAIVVIGDGDEVAGMMVGINGVSGGSKSVGDGDC